MLLVTGNLISADRADLPSKAAECSPPGQPEKLMEFEQSGNVKEFWVSLWKCKSVLNSI